MSEIQINTTQNVNIAFTAASVGERILAYGIDLIIKIAYATVIFQVVFELFGIGDMLNDMDDWSRIAVILIFLLPYFFYTLVLESIFEGQTIGKRLMKIQVVKIDGYQASFPDYLVRWFMRIIDINMVFGIVGLVSMVVSDKMQRLGDMVAGTSVITLKSKVRISHTILEELHDSYKPTYPSVIKLSDNDARIIKETFLTAKKSVDHATLLKLKLKIEEVIETKSQHSDTHSFIDTVMKDYNYYTQNM